LVKIESLNDEAFDILGVKIVDIIDFFEVGISGRVAVIFTIFYSISNFYFSS